MAARIAIYPGSFDPVTNGHVNIIERGLQLFDKIIVAVAVNSSKSTIFTVQERLEILRELFRKNQKVEIDSFVDTLLVEYAKSKGAHVILRGLRTVSDYEYEFQMAHANRALAPNIDTIFMMTESKYSHLSSTLIKEIVSYGGSCREMLDPVVEKRLQQKLATRK